MRGGRGEGCGGSGCEGQRNTAKLITMEPNILVAKYGTRRKLYSISMERKILVIKYGRQRNSYNISMEH